MKPIRTLCISALFLTAIAACVNVMADDAIDAEDFVEEASAKGLAEVETGKLALKKSTSAEVRKFAQQMVDDHTKANQELATIARTKKLDLADNVEMMNKAKAMILKQRDGESFDEAYANNQVMAHEQTISLFQKATRMNDAELKAFAQKTLPKLQHHLQMAQQLQAATDTKDDADREGGMGVGTGVRNGTGDETGTGTRGRDGGTGTGGRDVDNDSSIRIQPTQND